MFKLGRLRFLIERLFCLSERPPLLNEVELKEALEEITGEGEISPSPPPAEAKARIECIGCKDYYGGVHGGIALICGVYPYGYQGDAPKCPDWESKTAINIFGD